MQSALPDEEFPVPIALCLERIGADDDDRYVRCTARSGRLAGLAIGLGGELLWCEAKPVACELWVSRDQRLMAMRPPGAPRVRLIRAHREIDIPEEKPVVLRHQDVLVLADLEAVRFCVHVHGTTTEVHPPRPVRTARAVSLAVALTFGAAGCGGPASPMLEIEESGAPHLDQPEPGMWSVEDTGSMELDTTPSYDTAPRIAPAGDGGPRSKQPAAFDAGMLPVDEPDAIEIRAAPPK